MSEPGSPRSGLRPGSVPRAIASFLVAGLLVLGVVAAVLAISQRDLATAEAIRDARTLTNLEATDVVGPILTDDSLRPGPAHDLLDATVRNRVLGSHIVRVKIWDETGRIVYSDDAALIGLRFPLPDEELSALRTGRVSAEVSNLQEDENRDERQFGKLLQVYQGVQTPSGTRLLFETYQPYGVVTDSSRRMWLASLPILLGALGLLYLVQAPLAYRMARRLKAAQDERESLLLANLAASDRERAIIAADLHDGVVQGLAGASYSLTAAANRNRSADPAGAAFLSSTAADLRRWVRELRSLILTITPPALHAQGLAASLTDLVASLEVRGMNVTVDIPEIDDLDPGSSGLVYRAAQEAVRNVARHAEASRVAFSVNRPSPSRLVLRVVDDGKGFDPQMQTTRRRGSVGLVLLTTLVTEAGGTLELKAAAGHGTEFRLDLPVTPDTSELPSER